jgi:Tol biopolymer transport system component
MLVGFVAAVVLGGGTAKADFTFGEPTNLGSTVNSSVGDNAPYISADGLALYFHSGRPGGQGDSDLWVTTRSTTEQPWTEPVNLGPTVNSSARDQGASISADGLALYFHSARPGGYGDRDLWVTTRPTTNDIWTEPVNLGPTVNSSDREGRPCISSDGLSLYFNSPRSGGFGYDDLYVTTRVTVEDEWGPPANLGPTVNAPNNDITPRISADGRLLFFTSYDRPGGSGGADLWVATRSTVEDDWDTPVNLGPTVNSSAQEPGLGISTDGRTIYFYSNRPGGVGGHDIWQAPIIPIVDLNGDSIVDSADMCIIVDYWGTDEPLCDIGPMPWGDGIVDVEDLIVLAEHLFEDYRVIAHWRLDEEQGNIAYDSTGRYDGHLHGGPLWQSSGGKVGGALEFDGVDDYISIPFVLNPGEGSFSVFAWTKGGAPGQAIKSQAEGTVRPNSTWLCTDPTDGRLITRLMHPPFPLLESQSVITDGQWHHVGLVYDRDSMNRCLYVEGAEVARDVGPVAALRCDGGLYIGVGKGLEAGSFFSGLIDDVRIYDVALSAEEIAALAQ